MKFKKLPLDYNVKNKHFIYEHSNINIGERIGQIYFEKINNVSFIIENDLTNTDRGSGGFGSTGK
jgi:dUTPase